MKKYTLYCGLFDKDSKRQEINTIDAYKIASNLFVEYTGGATITEATGIYTHDNGEIVVEPSLRCEIFGATYEQIFAVVQQMKIVFNQESIAVEEMEVISNFM